MSRSTFYPAGEAAGACPNYPDHKKETPCNARQNSRALKKSNQRLHISRCKGLQLCLGQQLLGLLENDVCTVASTLILSAAVRYYYYIPKHAIATQCHIQAVTKNSAVEWLCCACCCA